MKLFNKQRARSMQSQQIKKYLFYAIGEIILVVVGILIALGINNWKSNEADQFELERIIGIVESDLQKDYDEAKHILQDEEESRKLLTKILYKPEFKDSIRDCERCKYLMVAGSITKFNNKGIDLLKNFNKEVRANNSKVDSIMNFYDLYKESYFQLHTNLVIEEIILNNRYLRDNYDWFHEYLSGYCGEPCKDYFESQNFINRLTFFEAVYYDGYIPAIEDYVDDANDLLVFLKASSNEDI